MTGKRIAGFDGLRAIAVGLVVFNHKVPIGGQIKPGGYGVHLFFVLSGFLIIGILYGRREAIAAGAASFRAELLHFYENRLYRIWPIYFLTIFGVAIALLAIGRPLSILHFLTLISFTVNVPQAYVWHDWAPRVGPMWSIAIEEQFYLWAAPVFLLAPRRLFAPICAGVIALAGAAYAIHAQMPQFPRANYVGSFTNFGLMAVGGLAVVAGRPQRWQARLAPFAAAIYVALPFAAWAMHLKGPAGEMLFWFSGVGVAVILLGIVADQQAWFVRVLEWPPIAYVGRISYGIYIYHGLIDLAEVRVLRPYLPGQTMTGLIEVLLSLIVAALSWRFIEQPMLRRRDNRRQRRAQAAALQRTPALGGR